MKRKYIWYSCNLDLCFCSYIKPGLLGDSIYYFNDIITFIGEL